MYTVFSAHGLKVGIHPIVRNQPRKAEWGDFHEDLGRMGGMSSAQLMAANLSDNKVDPVELFHGGLRPKACARRKRGPRFRRR